MLFYLFIAFAFDQGRGTSCLSGSRWQSFICESRRVAAAVCPVGNSGRGDVLSVGRKAMHAEVLADRPAPTPATQTQGAGSDTLIVNGGLAGGMNRGRAVMGANSAED